MRYFSRDSVDASAPMKVFPGTHDKLGSYAARFVHESLSSLNSTPHPHLPASFLRSQSVPTFPIPSIRAFLPTCLFAYSIPACLLPYLPTYHPACMSASLPVHLHVCLPPFQPADLPYSILPCRLVFSPVYLPFFTSPLIPAFLPTYLSPLPPFLFPFLFLFFSFFFSSLFIVSFICNPQTSKPREKRR